MVSVVDRSVLSGTCPKVGLSPRLHGCWAGGSVFGFFLFFFVFFLFVLCVYLLVFRTIFVLCFTENLAFSRDFSIVHFVYTFIMKEY